MKYAILLAAGAALSLSACQESSEPAPDATASATPEATAAAAPAAAAGAAAFTAGQPPSKEFMVGTWGEGEACDLPINFQADGTIKDGPFDTWTLTDGMLVMDDLVKLQLTVADADHMTTLPEGSTEEPHTIQRCG